MNKQKRKESVRRAVQRSPEAFIRNLYHHIRKKSNHQKAKLGKLNHACLELNLDYDYLINLYEKQHHKCALSGLIMSFEFGNSRSISIDRIDSSKGYQVGNVQLVCQAFNWMKNNSSQDEALTLLDDYFNERLRAHK